MSDRRKRAFLDRLWDIQEAYGFNDAELAREIGVAPSSICRAKQKKGRTFGVQFALRAIDRWPELGLILSSDSPIGNNAAPIGNIDEEQAS